MRAYVTSSDDAETSGMRARYGLPPRHMASSRLAAHERRDCPRVLFASRVPVETTGTIAPPAALSVAT